MKSIHYSIRYENQTVDEDLEDGNPEALGEAIPCQVGKGLWEVQFRTPFCPEPESVIVRFHS